MTIFNKNFEIDGFTVYYKHEKNLSKRKVKLGIINRDIDKLYKKYNIGIVKLNPKNTTIERTTDYISVFQEKIYLMKDMSHIKIDNSINETAIHLLNSYFDFLNKACLLKKRKISNTDEFYNFLGEKFINMLTKQGQDNVNMQHYLFLSKEKNTYYPSYIIQTPITPYITVKFFLLRHNGSYVYGTTYYNRSVTAYASISKEDLLENLLNLIFNEIYYKNTVGCVDRELFSERAKEYFEIYNLIKY